MERQEEAIPASERKYGAYLRTIAQNILGDPEEVRECLNDVWFRAWTRIPEEPPRTFPEALQFLRLLHYCLWMCFHYHNTLGRFDQYMYPISAAILTRGGWTAARPWHISRSFSFP